MRNLEIIIPEEKIQKEFEYFNQDKGYQSLCNKNEIILYFQWKEFYKKEIELWNENKMYHGLPLQSWIYLNRIKYLGKDATNLTDREILRSFKISGIHIGNSFHSPFWIKQFIKDYNINSIFDPCGGWGHRLLGAKDIKYIYNDINPITNLNVRKMCDYFNLKDKYFYNEDSQYLNVKEDYEAVFTCPPYYNIEIYSENGAENLSYEKFLQWWKQTVKQSIKPSCKYFAFVINHTLKQDMENICMECNLTKIKEISLGKQQYSHLNKSSRDNGEKGEYLLIFNFQ